MKIVSTSLLLALIVLFACKTAETSAVVSDDAAEMRKGTLIELPKRTTEGLLDEKELYFQCDGKNYFVKITECLVSEKKLKKFLNKPVVIQGEVKSGFYDVQKPASISMPESEQNPRKGAYIVIYSIEKE